MERAPSKAAHHVSPGLSTIGQEMHQTELVWARMGDV